MQRWTEWESRLAWVPSQAAVEALAADFGLARNEMIKNEDQLEESETMKAREINSMIRYTMWSVFQKGWSAGRSAAGDGRCNGAGNRSRHKRR